jgi:hypothetical protein
MPLSSICELSFKWKWPGVRASNRVASRHDAVREKLAACAQLEYLEGRAARGSREAYERVLARAPAVEPAPGDERRLEG